MLYTRVWKGKINFSLEKFIHHHRNAFVSMQFCAEYVQYQLPKEYTQVVYLLAGIIYNHAGLQAAMTSDHIGTSPPRKRNSFEGTANHLLLYYTMAKKKNPTSGDQVRSQTPQKSKHLALVPRPVLGRQEFISDTTSPHSMLLYPSTRRRNYVSGDSITLTARAAQKGRTTSAQIETSP